MKQSILDRAKIAIFAYNLHKQSTNSYLLGKLLFGKYLIMLSFGIKKNKKYLL
jgi:hypothetical protein